MSASPRIPSNGTNSNGSSQHLAERLRKTLEAARASEEIRARLKQMLAEPDRLDWIVRELGPRHAIVRDLIAITARVDSAADAAI